MSRCRALVVVLVLALALPGAAWAQGAGDEQYQDPFGDEPARTQPAERPAQPRAVQDDGGGLEDEPPVVPDDPEPQPEPEPDPAPAPDPDDGARDESTLPNTGSDPRVIAYLGVVFLLVGVGLRLRTIDPDAY
ncbi:MAG TPA: LPXTG cell wall anchor domain-containing protein [Solirubrobacteraceae bacterium]|nr:LPXTG cell wall anchor domain-containing protein [Solirubrobacteraceae bacterium]